MTKIKGPKFLQKLKAKLMIQDEFQKLSLLSKELKEGNASEVDKVYWDDTLATIKDYLEYVPEYQSLYETYKQRKFLVDYQVRLRKLRHHQGGILVASSLRGLFDTLIQQRKRHEKENDVIVVQGDWMSFEGDFTSIHKAMELTEEGVIFLRGANEELFLQLATEETPESFFLSCLPMDVQTGELVVTTGNSLDEPISIKNYIKDDSPNMVGKTLVAVQPEVGEPTKHMPQKNLILIAPGDAVRLEVKDHK